MLVGAIGAIVTLIVFLGYATHPYTSFSHWRSRACILAFFLSLAYAPWMAGYTESVEAKNPALVATGLALWGWILRLVVAISFIFLPVVIDSVNPVVRQSALCRPRDRRPADADLLGQMHPATVALRRRTRSLLTAIQANQAVVNAVAANPSAANIAAATKALGPANFAQLIKYQSQLKTLIVPYQAQVAYLGAHAAEFTDLANGAAKSPQQWQHWFWVDVAGMVVFIPTIWLIGGPWGVRKARRDAEEHDRAVEEELARLCAGLNPSSASASRGRRLSRGIRRTAARSWRPGVGGGHRRWLDCRR